MAEYMKNRRANRRRQLLEIRGSKCQFCGEEDIKLLDFHHRNLSEKSFGLSGCGLDKSWTKIQAELDKCDLVCYICHHIFTQAQYKNREIIPWNYKKDTPFVHGTCRTYQELSCKCNECKEAKRQYRAKLIGYDQLIL